MTKKSALTLAGGVAAALIAGLVALSINMGILRASGTPAGPGKLSSNPIVKTITETIRHKVPSGSDRPTKTVVIPRPASVAPSVGSVAAHGSEPEHEFGEKDDD